MHVEHLVQHQKHSCEVMPCLNPSHVFLLSQLLHSHYLFITKFLNRILTALLPHLSPSINILPQEIQRNKVEFIKTGWILQESRQKFLDFNNKTRHIDETANSSSMICLLFVKVGKHLEQFTLHLL